MDLCRHYKNEQMASYLLVTKSSPPLGGGAQKMSIEVRSSIQGARNFVFLSFSGGASPFDRSLFSYRFAPQNTKTQEVVGK